MTAGVCGEEATRPPEPARPGGGGVGGGGGPGSVTPVTVDKPLGAVGLSCSTEQKAMKATVQST